MQQLVNHVQVAASQVRMARLNAHHAPLQHTNLLVARHHALNVLQETTAPTLLVASHVQVAVSQVRMTKHNVTFVP